MDRYYSLSSDINSEVVSDLIDILNNSDFTKLTIYVSTPGGSNESTGVLIDLINKHKDKIELVATENLISNGFYLFVQCDVPIRFLDTFCGILIHKCWINVTSNGFLNKKGTDYLYIEAVNQYNKTYEVLLKEVLPKAKFNLFKSGGDVLIMGEDAKRVIYETRKLYFKNTNIENPQPNKKRVGVKKG